MHVVLRARYSVLRYRNYLPMVRQLVRATAERFAIKVYKLGVERNHLHLVTRAEPREDLANFLRTLAGQIAQRILKATRGNTLGKFWALPPFTRIVEWGKALRIAKAYVLQNELEASGVIPYTPRKARSLKRRPSLAPATVMVRRP